MERISASWLRPTVKINVRDIDVFDRLNDASIAIADGAARNKLDADRCK